jgi:hypothetical protein
MADPQSPPPENPGDPDVLSSQPRLGRVGLMIWLALPILIVLALWLVIDRDRGKPRPDMSGALGPGQRAPTGGERPRDGTRPAE